MMALAADFVLIIAVGLLFWYLRGLPDAIHERSVKRLEHDLAVKLEKFRASMQEELELMRISREQLQVYKIKEFLGFTDQMNRYLADPKSLERDRKKVSGMKERSLNLGTRLFFFASDASIRRYLEWREASQKLEDGETSPVNALYLYGQLMTEIRRDLGYSDTECGPAEYLRTFSTDWSESRMEERLAEVENDA